MKNVKIKELSQKEMMKINGGRICVKINFLIGTLDTCSSDKWKWCWE